MDGSRERREDRSNSRLSDQTGEQVSGSRERREDRSYSGLSDQAGEVSTLAFDFCCWGLDPGQCMWQACYPCPRFPWVLWLPPTPMTT